MAGGGGRRQWQEAVAGGGGMRQWQWQEGVVERVAGVAEKAPPSRHYTAKNYELQQVVENRIEQFCAAHIVQCCQQYCSALLHLIAG